MRAGGVTHQVRAYGEPQNTPLQEVRIVLLIAVGYFEADRRSVPDAQRPGYCPLRCQKPPCSNEAQRGGGDGAGKYREVAPCRPHFVFYRTCYTPPLEKGLFLFFCFKKEPSSGFPILF